MTKCRKCGGEMNWVGDGERRRCLDPNGEEHWDTCAERLFNLIKKTGTYYTHKEGKETVHGYESKRFGRKVYMREGTVTIGSSYKPTQHEESCNADPWENCACKTS